MSYWPEEGGAWGCQVNAHRAGWDGTICNDPCNWDCGAKERFRREYCDRGDDRCYQMYAFDPSTPQFTVDEKGLKWLIDEDPTALDDQVLFLYCHQFHETGGVLRNGRHFIAGIYVVDRVEPKDLSHKTLYRVIPKSDCSVQFADLRLPPERYSSLGRPYMRHFDAAAVRRMQESLWRTLGRTDAVNMERRRRFIDELDSHLEQASMANERRRVEEGRRYVDESGSFDSPFAALRDYQPSESEPASETEPAREPAPELSEAEELIDGDSSTQEAGVAVDDAAAEEAVVDDADTAEEEHEAVEDEEPRRAAEEPEPVVSAVSDAVEPLFRLSDLRRAARVYGDDVVRALWLAGTRPNAMILLRGSPGIGKSRLAMAITPRERRKIVAVPSTWRGREDLLGYPSPIDGQFQPTPFTTFLRSAERAWAQGSREPYVVIFEEFNLSPPEYWFSDLLVRSQYPPDDQDGRMIELGGTPPDDWEQEGTARVWLSPAIRILATINSDHTTRDLSPRVLDRVTLVQVGMKPEAMISSLELDIDDEQVQAIKDLHHRLKSRGAVFSMRTALSIERGLVECERLDADQWEILDLVLVTQVLSKVRLYVGQPGDHELAVDLAENWSEEWGASLPLCAGRFENWREKLESGFDIVQA